MSEQPSQQQAQSQPSGESGEQTLEGWIPDLAAPEEVFGALNEAFDYRGDVTITKRDGTEVEGYVFDRRTGQGLDDSSIRLMPKGSDGIETIRYADVARLHFSGKDTAAGRSFERWLQKYVKKKMAGEKAEIHDDHPEDGRPKKD